MHWPLYRLFSSLVSPAGRCAKLQILIYHSVLTEHDPLRPGDPDIKAFRWQMRTLANYFNVLPLAEAVQHLQEGTLPSRAACITFDDGYRDNVDNALLILKEFGLPATFFIATGFLNGGMMWNDRIIESIRHCDEAGIDLSDFGLGDVPLGDNAKKLAAIKLIIPQLKHLPYEQRAEKVDLIIKKTNYSSTVDLMMNDEHVRQLRKSGMEIGAHTVNHPILSKLNEQQVEQEIAESKSYLEHLLDEPITAFAYPNGRPGDDYLAEHPEIVKRLGFSLALSTQSGVSTRTTDIYQLNRFTPWDKSPNRFFLRLMRNGVGI